jgi:hypothetical protein
MGPHTVARRKTLVALGVSVSSDAILPFASGQQDPVNVGRTLGDGHRHDLGWGPEWLDIRSEVGVGFGRSLKLSPVVAHGLSEGPEI